MDEILRSSAFELLALYERRLYAAIDEKNDNMFSVACAWRYHGIMAAEVDRLYFNEHSLTKNEWIELGSYLDSVVYYDAYCNMVNRLKDRKR